MLGKVLTCTRIGQSNLAEIELDVLGLEDTLCTNKSKRVHAVTKFPTEHLLIGSTYELTGQFHLRVDDLGLYTMCMIITRYEWIDAPIDAAPLPSFQIPNATITSVSHSVHCKDPVSKEMWHFMTVKWSCEGLFLPLPSALREQSLEMAFEEEHGGGSGTIDAHLGNKTMVKGVVLSFGWDFACVATGVVTQA